MGTKQEHFFLQHVQDLYHRTIYNDYPSFTEFLTTGEMSALLQNQKMFPSVVQIQPFRHYSLTSFTIFEHF